MNAPPRNIYLESYLAPLSEWLARDDVTDIYVNRPGELWLETLGSSPQRFAVPELTREVLARLVRQIAAVTAQGINREHPLLSASLPGGERVQAVIPPATRGELALAIRKHVSQGLALDDYRASGATAGTKIGNAEDHQPRKLEQASGTDAVDLLREAVRARRNVLVSGGTSSGKTTFVNALLKEIPLRERLILIEDAAEVRIEHPNAVGLLAVRGEMGEAKITTEDLLQACLRMRPDRIILGELRGREAASFLRAVNTGHPGSITTLHADSPTGAIDQLSLMVLQAGLNLGRLEIADYVRSVIDVFVQLTRTNGRRRVSQIVFKPA